MAPLDLAPGTLQGPLPFPAVHPATLTGDQRQLTLGSALFTQCILLACPPPTPITLSAPPTSLRRFPSPERSPGVQHPLAAQTSGPRSPGAIWNLETRPGDAGFSAKELCSRLCSHQTKPPTLPPAGRLLPAREPYNRSHKKAGSGKQPGMRQVRRAQALLLGTKH